MDLSFADLRDADLRGVYTIGANFARARLLGANILTSNGLIPISLKYSIGLSAKQLDEMVGDTSVMLPDGMTHPEHWLYVLPEEHDSVESKTLAVLDEARTPTDPFVFLSYSRNNQHFAKGVRQALETSGLRVWWDQDISAGDNWRESVDVYLENASVVVTLWSVDSVNSVAVREEAARAQRNRKLVHARLDDASLPYGFSETQYADLRGWDGFSDGPELRKLIQSVRDRLFPPSADEVRQRLTAAAPLAAILEAGKVGAKDSPPNAEPPFPDNEDLELRLHAQQVLANKALTALNALDNNLGEAIRFDISHLSDQLNARPPSWYILSDCISDLKIYLDMGDELSWPGSTRNTVESLCRNHEALRPRLQPLQLNPMSPEAPLPPPDPDVRKMSDDVLKEISSNASLAFGGAEAATVLAESAIRTGEYLAVEIDEARQIPVLSPKTEEQKVRKMRSGLIALAGFLGTTIASISHGVGSNLLTSPEAAKTLIQVLQKIFDMVTSLF